MNISQLRNLTVHPPAQPVPLSTSLLRRNCVMEHMAIKWQWVGCQISQQAKKELTAMTPLQLSPVATLNSVRKAIPKLLKLACSFIPKQGCSTEHSKIAILTIQNVNSQQCFTFATLLDQNKISLAWEIWLLTLLPTEWTWPLVD